MSEQMAFFDEPPAAMKPTRRQRAVFLRNRGIERAIAHADAEFTSWSDVAFAHLKVFVLRRARGATFTAEQIREHADKQGFRSPPDRRAWGAVMLRAARAGLIRKNGWTIATDPRVHCNPVTEWCKP